MNFYRDVYLKSEDWQNLRTAVLADRTRQRCELCGKQHKSLDVHHLRYRDLYNVSPSDLRVLCRDCHERAHGLVKLNGWERLHFRVKWTNILNEFRKQQSPMQLLWGRLQGKVRRLKNQLRKLHLESKIRRLKELELRLAESLQVGVEQTL